MALSKKRVLLDTNVVIDIFGVTQSCFASIAAADVALISDFKLCLTTSQLPSIAYLLPARKLKTKQETSVVFDYILKNFEILDVVALDCLNAYEQHYKGYEDDLIIQSCYRNDVACIVTRDKTGFQKSVVATYSPEEFIERFKPSNYDYDELEF